MKIKKLFPIETDNWQRKTSFLTLLGAFQFIILTIIAMFFYPAGYSFWTDHFSTLGLIYTRSIPKILNIISFILFIIAMVLAGILFIPFWLSIPSRFKDKAWINSLSWICLTIGVASSTFIVLIPIFPADFFPIQHVFTAVGFFLTFTIAVFLHSILILTNGKHAILFSLIGFTTAAFGATYVFGLCTGMYGGIFGALDATIQKFAIYSFMIWIIFQIIKNQHASK
ncbi:MAG: hypothetical protein ACTSVY_03215 [Candidatus Helarchaeota archaeon]